MSTAPTLPPLPKKVRMCSAHGDFETHTDGALIAYATQAATAHAAALAQRVEDLQRLLAYEQKRNGVSWPNRIGGLEVVEVDHAAARKGEKHG